MLSPVEAIQLQTRQAAEDTIMRFIDNASRIDGKTDIWVQNTNLPDWLIIKLKESGYKVVQEDQSSQIIWGYGNDK